MVAVAAISTTYLQAQTRRSRRQIWYKTTHPPLRIRNRTIAVHFVYVYVLLIRSTYLYTYTFIVSATTIAPITAITVINLTHRPTLFIISVLLYLPSYLLSVYFYHILAALYLRGETGGSLFCLSCPFYIRILILIRTMYTSCCGPPG